VVEGPGARDDVLLEGHEVPDGRRHRDRRPERGARQGDGLPRMGQGARTRLGQHGAVVTEQVEQPAVPGEAVDTAVDDDADVLEAVTARDVGGPAHEFVPFRWRARQARR
jgi:hypothetical protein